MPWNLIQKEHIKTEEVRILSFVLIRSHAHDLSIRAQNLFSDHEKFFGFFLILLLSLSPNVLNNPFHTERVTFSRNPIFIITCALLKQGFLSSGVHSLADTIYPESECG